MYETPEELRDLQDLLDRSFAISSEHLTSIMEPERRLAAEQLAVDLPSPAILNIATVTARGEPRVSAVDGHFLHGRWYFTTAVDSPKARQLRARPAISASYTPRDGYGVFVHGVATPLEGANRDMLREHWIATYGPAPEELGDIAYFRIDPHWMTGFAFPEEEIAALLAERPRG